MEFEHCSVLLKETIDNLKIKNDGIYVDGTLADILMRSPGALEKTEG